MKRLGIIGGVSYQSTVTYYDRINRQINEALGKRYSAEITMFSVNFENIFRHMSIEDWEPVYEQLLYALKKIEAGGADFWLVAANTMHRFADRLQEQTSVPILHIADCVAKECLTQGVKKVALLGTSFTMRQDFLKARLVKNGLTPIIPKNKSTQEKIHKIIVEELIFGKILKNSREYYKKTIENMAIRYGVEGVILGCTEIELLIKPSDVSIPVFDTTQAHINSAVDLIVSSV
jgi:aspartate racemase